MPQMALKYDLQVTLRVRRFVSHFAVFPRPKHTLVDHPSAPIVITALPTQIEIPQGQLPSRDPSSMKLSRDR